MLRFSHEHLLDAPAMTEEARNPIMTSQAKGAELERKPKSEPENRIQVFQHENTRDHTSSDHEPFPASKSLPTLLKRKNQFFVVEGGSLIEIRVPEAAAIGAVQKPEE